jgi:hypothetical protein
MNTKRYLHNSFHTQAAWMQDLCTRFLFLLPDSEVFDTVRTLYHIERMHWFAMDHYGLGRDVTLGAFIKLLCQHLAIPPHIYLNSLAMYREYLAQIPVYGVVLLRRVPLAQSQSDQSQSDQKPLVREQSLCDFQKPLVREQSLCDFQNSHANSANPQDFQTYLLMAQSAVSGKWSFPCGKQNQFETPLQTAWRETAEETGVQYDSACMRPLTHHAGWSWYNRSRTTPTPMMLYGYQMDSSDRDAIPMLDSVPNTRVDSDHKHACRLCRNPKNMILHQCRSTLKCGVQNKETRAVAWH